MVYVAGEETGGDGGVVGRGVTAGVDSRGNVGGVTLESGVVGAGELDPGSVGSGRLSPVSVGRGVTGGSSGVDRAVDGVGSSPSVITLSEAAGAEGVEPGVGIGGVRSRSMGVGVVTGGRDDVGESEPNRSLSLWLLEGVGRLVDCCIARTRAARSLLLLDVLSPGRGVEVTPVARFVESLVAGVRLEGRVGGGVGVAAAGELPGGVELAVSAVSSDGALIGGVASVGSPSDM